MKELEHYVDIQRAMEFLGFKSQSGFKKFAKEAGLKKYKLGHRTVRYRLSEIRAFVEKRRVS